MFWTRNQPFLNIPPLFHEALRHSAFLWSTLFSRLH